MVESRWSWMNSRGRMRSWRRRSCVERVVSDASWRRRRGAHNDLVLANSLVAEKEDVFAHKLKIGSDIAHQRRLLRVAIRRIGISRSLPNNINERTPDSCSCTGHAKSQPGQCSCRRAGSRTPSSGHEDRSQPGRREQSPSPQREGSTARPHVSTLQRVTKLKDERNWAQGQCPYRRAAHAVPPWS